MPKIVAISHDPKEGPNRCTDWLQANGFRVSATCPAVGEAIPALDADVAGLVVFGGKYDVDQQDDHPFLTQELKLLEAALRRGMPVLGICLGGQLLAHVLGSPVGRHPAGFVEYGYYDLVPTAEGQSLFGEGLKVLQSHWHGWFETPRGAVKLAATVRFPQQAFGYGPAAYGLQFHPEATRATLEGWIGRRPPERHAMPGAHPPDRQLQDFDVYDAALGRWFEGFLGRWIGDLRMKEAAE